MSIIIYIIFSYLIKNVILIVSCCDFHSSLFSLLGGEKKKCLLAIHSFSDSPSLHSHVSKAPTTQAAKIVQWAMCTGSLSPCSEVIKGEVKNCLMSSELQTLQWVHFTLRHLHMHHPQPSTCLWNMRDTEHLPLSSTNSALLTLLLAWKYIKYEKKSEELWLHLS